MITALKSSTDLQMNEGVDKLKVTYSLNIYLQGWWNFGPDISCHEVIEGKRVLWYTGYE